MVQYTISLNSDVPLKPVAVANNHPKMRAGKSFGHAIYQKQLQLERQQHKLDDIKESKMPMDLKVNQQTDLDLTTDPSQFAQSDTPLGRSMLQSIALATSTPMSVTAKNSIMSPIQFAHSSSSLDTPVPMQNTTRLIKPNGFRNTLMKCQQIAAKSIVFDETASSSTSVCSDVNNSTLVDSTTIGTEATESDVNDVTLTPLSLTTKLSDSAKLRADELKAQEQLLYKQFMEDADDKCPVEHIYNPSKARRISGSPSGHLTDESIEQLDATELAKLQRKKEFRAINNRKSLESRYKQKVLRCNNSLMLLFLRQRITEYQMRIESLMEVILGDDNVAN